MATPARDKEASHSLPSMVRIWLDLLQECFSVNLLDWSFDRTIFLNK